MRCQALPGVQAPVSLHGIFLPIRGSEDHENQRPATFLLALTKPSLLWLDAASLGA
jgi:hypothetical protein